MEYWIWLNQLRGIGPILQKKLLKAFEGDPENIYRASTADLIEVDGVGEVTAQKINAFRLDDVKAIIDRVEKLNMKLVTVAEEGLEEVFSCKRSPILFYYRGQLPKERGVAVVGARRCTEDAKRAASEIASVVGERGRAVISGMAKGVDSYAHTGCLRVGGYTMAVLANGVDICYPKEHRRLYEKIVADGGSVLSAYPPGVKPHPKFFLERNAHIAAWSTDVVVVQASVNSGSLTTARFALEQGRNLYVVPHSIYVREAEGSNSLLDAGARPYLGSSSLSLVNMVEEKSVDIGDLKEVAGQLGDCSAAIDRGRVSRTQRPLKGIGTSRISNTNTPSFPLSSIEKKLITYLNKTGNCSIDELAHYLQIPELDLNPTLTNLEINGVLKIKGRTLSSV